MSKEQSDLHKFIADFKKEFLTLKPEMIAFLEVVIILRKYASNSSIFIKAHLFM